MPDNPTIWQLFDLKGKVFLVAGGARDLGRDMALALAEAHGQGMVTSRRPAAAAAAAKAVNEATGQRVVGAGLDATDEPAVQRVVRDCLEKFDRIDVLVNCVGGHGGSDGDAKASANLEDRPRSEWDKLLAVNLTAPFLLCKHVAPIMKKQRSGAIINIASMAAMVGLDRSMFVDGAQPRPIDYAAAKAGVLGLTRELATCLGPDRIRVNAISPGAFERGQPREFLTRYKRKTLLDRLGKDGQDIKGAVVFLASDAGAYITGQNIVIDGGFTAWH